jgi:hypothetical protein
MRTTPRTLKTLFALAAAGALQAGCGDSRYQDAAPPAAAPPPPAAAGHDLPAHALASIAGLVQWARGLSTSEVAEPLRVEGAQLPFSDTAEPLSL